MKRRRQVDQDWWEAEDGAACRALCREWAQHRLDAGQFERKVGALVRRAVESRGVDAYGWFVELEASLAHADEPPRPNAGRPAPRAPAIKASPSAKRSTSPRPSPAPAPAPGKSGHKAVCLPPTLTILILGALACIWLPVSTVLAMGIRPTTPLNGSITSCRWRPRFA
jgi:hypothetical protein